VRRPPLLAAAAAAGLALLLATGREAAAHKPSDAYLRLAVGPGGAVSGSLDVALRDLELVVGLDGDGDGAVTWGELKARHAAVDAYALSRLALASPGGACALRPTERLVDEHTDGAYAVLRFEAACPAPAGRLSLRYGLLFDVDPTHRGLVTVSDAGGTRATVLSPDRPEVSLEASAARSAELGRYLRLGLEHIAFGYDHLLFLLVLLLPAVYRRDAAGAREPVPSWPRALVDVAKILTAFTVAHGISLAAAVTGLVEPPARLVESAIAATIVLAALDNLRPFLPADRWLVALGFGLVHGLGFAAALGPLDLPAPDLAVALLGFNLGIEAGQAALALPFLAAAYPLRTFVLYARGILPLGSAAAAVLAGLWLVDRAFAVAVAPF
jgi:hypothetical protein